MKNTYLKLLACLFLFSTLSLQSVASIPINYPTETTEATPKDEKPPKKKFKNANINGILSMSFGIATFVIFPIFAIPAVIFGVISLTKHEPKSGYAIAGLIMGGLGVLLLVGLFALLALGLL